MGYSDRLLWECHDYIEHNCVTYKGKKGLTLSSGKESSIYYDIKDGIVRDPYFATSICTLIDHTIEEIEYDTVAGLALGGVLISDRFIQYKHFHGRMVNNFAPNYLVVRNSVKLHGMGGLVIGNCEEAENIVMIEDVITSGESVMNGIDAIKEVNPHVNIVAIVCVMDRTNWFYDDRNWFEESYIEMHDSQYLPLYRQK